METLARLLRKKSIHMSTAFGDARLDDASSLLVSEWETASG